MKPVISINMKRELKYDYDYDAIGQMLEKDGTDLDQFFKRVKMTLPTKYKIEQISKKAIDNAKPDGVNDTLHVSSTWLYEELKDMGLIHIGIASFRKKRKEIKGFVASTKRTKKNNHSEMVFDINEISELIKQNPW